MPPSATHLVALPRWRALVAEGARRAREAGRPVLVSASLPWPGPRFPTLDPLDVWELWDESGTGQRASHRFFWTSPQGGFTLLAAGTAWTVEAEEPGRFDTVGAAWQQLLRGALVDGLADGPPGLPLGPVATAGFAFDPQRPASPWWDGFPAAGLVVPSLQLCFRPGEVWLTLNTVLEPDLSPGAPPAALSPEEVWWPLLAALGQEERPAGDPAELDPGSAQGPSYEAPANGRTGRPHGEAEPPEERRAWAEGVRQLLAAIGQGRLQKAVLARAQRVRRLGGLGSTPVLRRLRAQYPSCHTFAVVRGERCFLGATPELLARVAGGKVTSMALAGTGPRGDSPEEDGRLRRQLLASPKDQYEHQLVTRYLREALTRLCTQVHLPEGPTVLALSGVQHLYTPLEGVLRPGLSLLDVVAEIHPTPAVAGWPRDEALACLRQVEPFDRGWYSGPVGWVDSQGGGEFAVAIRSALLAGDEAILFAGCGIVAGSDPEREFLESRLKLAVMRQALGLPAGGGQG